MNTEQVYLDTTDLTTLLQGKNKKPNITQILVTNITAGAVTCSLFIDQSGANFADSTALMKNKSIPANDYVVLENTELFLDSSGAFGAQAGATNSIVVTFTYK